MNAAQRRRAMRATRSAFPLQSVWHFKYASVYQGLARAGHHNVQIVSHRSPTRALVEASPSQPERSLHIVKLRHLSARRPNMQLEPVISA